MTEDERPSANQLRRTYNNISIQPYHVELILDLQRRGWLNPRSRGREAQVGKVVSLSPEESILARAILSLGVSLNSGLPLRAAERAASALQKLDEGRQNTCSHNKGYVP